MSDKIRVRVIREYAVDARGWAQEYGLVDDDLESVREDIGHSLSFDDGENADFAAFHFPDNVQQTSRVVEFL